VGWWGVGGCLRCAWGGGLGGVGCGGWLLLWLGVWGGGGGGGRTASPCSEKQKQRALARQRRHVEGLKPVPPAMRQTRDAQRGKPTPRPDGTNTGHARRAHPSSAPQPARRAARPPACPPVYPPATPAARAVCSAPHRHRMRDCRYRKRRGVRRRRARHHPPLHPPARAVRPATATAAAAPTRGRSDRPRGRTAADQCAPPAARGAAPKAGVWPPPPPPVASVQSGRGR